MGSFLTEGLQFFSDKCEVYLEDPEGTFLAKREIFLPTWIWFCLASYTNFIISVEEDACDLHPQRSMKLVRFYAWINLNSTVELLFNDESTVVLTERKLFDYSWPLPPNRAHSYVRLFWVQSFG